MNTGRRSWLFAVAMLINTGAAYAEGIPVFVNDKQVQLLTNEQLDAGLNLTATKLENIPIASQWLYVRIDSGEANRLQFRDWKQKYAGKQIIIQRHADTTQLGLYKPGSDKPLYQMNNPTIISILTHPPVKSPAAKQTGNTDGSAALKVSYKGRNYKISIVEIQDQLTRQAADYSNQLGWPLLQVLALMKIEQAYHKISLGCDNNARPMVISADQAGLSFIKLNQRDEWRVVRTQPDQADKKDWLKCNNLAEINLY